MAQCVWQQTLGIFKPCVFAASSTSSLLMPPMASTPSKPASLTAANFSITEPFTPIMAYMIAFLIARCFVFSAAKVGAMAAAPVASAVVCRNVRRFMLDKFGFAGHGDGGHLQRRVPGEVFRHQVLLRIHCCFPCDDLSGVGRHASHDREHRAAGHPLAVVDRLAIADRLEQLVMLRLVHVVALAFIFPRFLPDDAVDVARAIDGAFAFGAGNVHGVIARASGNLPALVEGARA